MEEEEEKEDRLSALPDAILTQILALTNSYKTPAISSTLSTRWRKLYTLVPSTYFSPDDIWGRIHHSAASVYAVRFRHIVSTALFRRRDEIQTLRLKLLDRQCLSSWLRYCASLNVKNLQIDEHFIFAKIKSYHANFVPENDDIHDINMHRLLFGDIVFTKSSQFTLSFLVSVRLDWVFSLNAKWVSRLIQWSPVLRELSLSFCEFRCSLRISSHSLVDLGFRNCEFRNCLRVFCLDLRVLTFEGCNVGDPFRCLTIDCPALDELCLDCSWLKNPNRVPSPGFLRLTGVPIPSPALWKALAGIGEFRSLALQFTCDGSAGFNQEDGTMVDEYDAYELKELEMVMLEVAAFQDQEKRFVTQILHNCPKLSLLKISFEWSVPCPDYQEFINEISQSKRVKVVIM